MNYELVFGFLIFAHEHTSTRAYEGSIRAEPRKPAKRNADVMQGVKERACELLLRPCSHKAGRCGLEGGDRRQQRWGAGGVAGMPKSISLINLKT
jgi:hypothetical protein